jgi:hypothetical protein
VSASPMAERRTSRKSGTDGDRTPIFVMAVLASALAVCGVLAWLLTFVLARGEVGQGRSAAVPRERSRAPRAPGGGVRLDEPQLWDAPPRRAEPAHDPVGATVHEECEIEWFRGYVKSQFLAVADGPSEAFVRESPWFSWRGTTPPPQDQPIAAARDRLLQALLRDGWERSGVGEQWYSDRLQRTVYVGADV